LRGGRAKCIAMESRQMPGAGGSFLTIGQSVEASLGGGGGQRRTSTTPQRSMWLAGDPVDRSEPQCLTAHSIRDQG
jgi:hypothetical protein